MAQELSMESLQSLRQRRCSREMMSKEATSQRQEWALDSARWTYL